ncbi:MAG: hypothetical protein DWH91_04445 [Planctomycetota bacterium]|nr:MAG: hypothetical protein DWH91_04445 [Planctomycetota bacterium]
MAIMQESSVVSQRRVYLILAFCAILSSTFPVIAQEAPKKSTARDTVEAANLEFALTSEEIDALRAQTFDILLKTGKKETGATLVEFLRNKQLPDRFRSLEFTPEGGKRNKKISTELVFQIEQGETVYEVASLPIQRYHVLVDVKKRNDAIRTRLEATGEQFWAPLTPEDAQKHIAEEKTFLEGVAKHFSTLPMQLHETEYFLFLSDMPPAQVAPYVKQLDKMNEALGQSFGFPPGHNVWRGKAVIVVFVNLLAFQEFEVQFMKNSDFGGAQGLCHQFGDGRVVTACYRGDSPEFLGAVLVHETAHGYLHRYRTTSHVVTWLNEGIADWIAGVAVPSTPEIRRRQQEAANRLRQSGSFQQQFYTSEDLESWQYGAASSIVQMLIQANPQQFQLFFNGVKEGYTWQDSLMRAYGMTPEELTIAYGQRIGLPRLTP